MRASFNAMVLFLLLTSGCFGIRDGLDGDSDGGLSSTWESGVSDSGNTGGSFAPFDARITFDAPRTTPVVCGNNIKEEGEICDGTDLGGATCGTLAPGLIGTLACSADCLNYDTTMCYSPPGVCGNNVKEDGEICDGTDLAGATCDTLMSGYVGTLSCARDCLNYDTAMCYPSSYPLDAGRPDYDDDAGVDDVIRIPVTGGCARSTGAYCQSDRDCVQGGCGGELRYNPAYGEIMTTCDCTAPANLSCGCVNGVCTWWSADPVYGI
jgi:hypothetical protein